MAAKCHTCLTGTVCDDLIFNFDAEVRITRMLSRIALEVPRFSMTSERRSASTRFKSLPKLERALSADTTIESFLSVVRVATNTPLHYLEPYSLYPGQSMRECGYRRTHGFAGVLLST